MGEFAGACGLAAGNPADSRRRVATTRTIRHVETEVEVGPDQGLPTVCAISLDNLGVVEKDRLVRRIATADADVMNQIFEAIHTVFGLPY